MLAKVYFSQNPVLRFAVEEVLLKFHDDIFLLKKEYDLVLIALSPEVYPWDEEVVRTFDHYFGKNRWLAFHSLTSFANEKVVEKSLTALFIRFERKGRFHIFHMKDLTKNYQKALRLTAEYLKNRPKHSLNIILTSFSHGRIGFFIEDLAKYLTKTSNIVGGVASGLEQNGKTITEIFTSKGIINDGFAILSLENVVSRFGISFGYIPIGPVYTITRAEENFVYEINGESIEFLKRNLLRNLEDDIRYLWYIPMLVLNEEGLVSILRSYKGFGKDFVEFYGPIKEGWKFRFSFADKNELIKADREEALKIKEALKSVDLAFNFSCVARQYVLEELQTEESKLYASILNAPLFGFYTFGEIGPDKGGKDLKYYNQTSVVMAVREI